MVGEEPIVEVRDEDTLTHYGSKRNPAEGLYPFRKRPKRRDETSMSTFLGRLSPAEAKLALSGYAVMAGEGVRYTTVGQLREAGFTVWANHQVTRRSPDGTRRTFTHVRVEVNSSWTDDVAERFDGTFGEPRWEGE